MAATIISTHHATSFVLFLGGFEHRNGKCVAAHLSGFVIDHLPEPFVLGHDLGRDLLLRLHVARGHGSQRHRLRSFNFNHGANDESRLWNEHHHGDHDFVGH